MGRVPPFDLTKTGVMGKVTPEARGVAFPKAVLAGTAFEPSVPLTPDGAIHRWRAGIMWNAFWIFIGGGLGSLARWSCSGLVAKAIGETFPWGTLAVNVSGCFVIGLFNAITGTEGRWLLPASFRQFFMWGVCGGYTTFSSFGLQTLNLAQDGEWFRAGANAVLSLVLCLLGVWSGHVLGASLNAAPR